MTPEDAICHEWLKASPAQQELRRSPSEVARTQPQQQPQPQEPRRVTEGEPSGVSQQYSLYRLYRGKKCASKLLPAGEAHQIESGDIPAKPKVNSGGSASSSNRTTAAMGELLPTLDPNLDDSGTFLPPIL